MKASEIIKDLEAKLQAAEDRVKNAEGWLKAHQWVLIPMAFVAGIWLGLAF